MQSRGDVCLDATVVACDLDNASRRWTVTYETRAGQRHSLSADHVISSAPIQQLVNGITPRMSEASPATWVLIRKFGSSEWTE